MFNLPKASSLALVLALTTGLGLTSMASANTHAAEVKDHAPSNLLAEGGADRLHERGLAEGGADRLLAAHMG